MPKRTKDIWAEIKNEVTKEILRSELGEVTDLAVYEAIERIHDSEVSIEFAVDEAVYQNFHLMPSNNAELKMFNHLSKTPDMSKLSRHAAYREVKEFMVDYVVEGVIASVIYDHQ